VAKFAEDTKVPVGQSRNEIESTLKRFGASHFAFQVSPEKAMVAFRTNDRNIRFDLPLPQRESFRDQRGQEREERRRWRALLLTIKARLASVESEIETFEQAFMAHVVMPDGRTISETIGGQIALAYDTGKPTALLPGPKS
jgi:hypothetical protein